MSRRVRQSNNDKLSAKPVKPASPWVTTCISLRCFKAYPYCRKNGGTQNGSKTTLTPSWIHQPQKPRKKPNPLRNLPAGAIVSITKRILTNRRNGDRGWANHF